MNSGQLFISYWYFYVPAYALAALMYTFLGRLVLGIIFRSPDDNYIYKAFVRLTDPVLGLIRFVTPLSVNPRMVLVFAAIWMLAARIIFQSIMFELDLAPRVTTIAPQPAAPATQDNPQ